MNELKKYHSRPEVNYQSLSPLEKFKHNLNTFGFLIPEFAEFYKVTENGKIGMKVGGFTHSCHVESSDVIILFHMDEDSNHFIQEYWGCWDLEKIN